MLKSLTVYDMTWKRSVEKTGLDSRFAALEADAFPLEKRGTVCAVSKRSKKSCYILHTTAWIVIAFTMSWVCRDKQKRIKSKTFVENMDKRRQYITNID